MLILLLPNNVRHKCWMIRALVITRCFAYGNPHLLKGFQYFNVPKDFFESLSAEFAACSKPQSRDNHPKAPYEGRNNLTRAGVVSQVM